MYYPFQATTTLTFFNCTNSIILQLICSEKSTMKNLLIDNNGNTTQLSTIIFCTMRRKHIIMSLLNLGCFYDTGQDKNCTCTRLLNFNYDGTTQIITTYFHTMSSVITRFFIFCCTCVQVFYCTNSIENQTKKIKYSRNFFAVKMVWDDM